MTLDTTKAPDLTNKSIRRVWIKDGKRKVPTSDGYMSLNSSASRKLFGKFKQGRYSLTQ